MLKQLNRVGGFVHNWIKGMYGRDMVLVVGREADKHTEVINLIQLMYQMTTRPKVVTRTRYFKMLNLPERSAVWPQAALDDLRWEQNDSWFTDHIGAGEYLDVQKIKKDRNWLEKKCRYVMRYRHKIVAHRSSMELTLTIEQIDAALDAIETMLQKYYVLFFGAALMGAEPAIQFDWEEVFTYPWIVPPANDD